MVVLHRVKVSVAQVQVVAHPLGRVALHEKKRLQHIGGVLFLTTQARLGNQLFEQVDR